MKKFILTLIVLATSHLAYAQYIGEIRMFAGTFAPYGWALCQGQILPIYENEALFVIIGTTYGGDGVNTFALPDLRGRAPIHQGTVYPIGQAGGTESNVLITNNLPSHSHLITVTQAASKEEGDSKSPENKYPAVDGTNFYGQAAANATNITSKSTAVTLQPSGSNIPVENRQQYVAVNYIISLYGVFPTQQ